MRLIDADELYGIERLLANVAKSKETQYFMEQVLFDISNMPTVAAAPRWISVKEGPPKDRRSVNVVVEHKRDDGKVFQFVMTASHIGHHEIEAEEWPDYDGDTEYDEENDCYWIPENWYEDNFMEDNLNYLICDEYRVTHWMPLPEPPKEEGKWD